jgi:hypothetical protein
MYILWKMVMPKTSWVRQRIKALNNLGHGEQRPYCSKSCKKECPIYGKSAEQLMKEDAVRAGRILPLALNREVQPELRWLVLKRDNYTCQICGSKHSLHCHHFEGVWQNQLMSADIDMCITLCKHCHLKAHKEPGCRYVDMQRGKC